MLSVPFAHTTALPGHVVGSGSKSRKAGLSGGAHKRDRGFLQGLCRLPILLMGSSGMEMAGGKKTEVYVCECVYMYVCEYVYVSGQTSWPFMIRTFR